MPSAHEAFPMGFSGAHSNAEMMGDLLIGMTLGGQSQDLAFAGSQPRQRLAFAVPADLG
jgi:hypothetical protein